MSIHTLIQRAAGTGRGVEELNGHIAAYNIYETADGRFISLGAVENKFWQNFCHAVGKSDWIDENLTEAKPDNKVYAEMAALFKSKSFAEWTRFSLEVDCCMAPVLETNEMLNSALLKDKGLLTGIMDGQPPALGQHNGEIFE
ncbi:MAG: CoA transferase [Thermincola sp.]|jgi:crotonobetainyl-CoA:carnitine CoA-transferase CaiB-like acyl-CoA transferase|nr:CoA transferase [Thermincola sp.]MDT3704619.1 CoA transferase [Thermincola sp.]